MSVPKRKFTASELVPGKSYRVIAEFKDYDNIIHPIGESWRFTEKSFLPYEDGLSLFVEMNDQRKQIRLQWRPEAQGPVIDSFYEFVIEG